MKIFHTNLFAIMIALFTESFGQNCNMVVGNNVSIVGLIHYPTVNDYPWAFQSRGVVYSNGSFALYDGITPNNFEYQGTGTYNISASGNSDVDCYMHINWQAGSLNGNTSCFAYSVITNPDGIIGCFLAVDFDNISPICPSSCGAQYILQANHTWYGWIDDNSNRKSQVINRKSEVITHPKIEQKKKVTNCGSLIGYNSSMVTAAYRYVPYPTVFYYSLYTNSSLLSFGYNGYYYGTAVYNISQSSFPHVSCLLKLKWQDGQAEGASWCMSYSVDSNGTGTVGCWNYQGLCTADCSSNVFQDYPFVTSIRYNAI